MRTVLMIQVDCFDYKNASAILKEKGLYAELSDVLKSIAEIDHCMIQEALRDKGWATEERIIPETQWRWDAYKDRVVVSIEFSELDAVHRDFFRLLMWHYDDKADAVVYITTTFKEPKFHNVKRDIEICSRSYPGLLPIPILLIGLSNEV